jgi:hypothetical protein
MRQITASRAKVIEGMSIGRLSPLTDVNLETICSYERIKVVP